MAFYFWEERKSEDSKVTIDIHYIIISYAYHIGAKLYTLTEIFTY